MGIKGIYAEIGPGKRISLAKLAVEHYEETNRPLRVAIDVSIWQFQVQAGQGGTNPALRTFFYRLVKLLGYQIQPLFIFDGPHKPPVKRNKKTGNGSVAPNRLTKQLLKLFGFPFHMAPGEAEAECALLQREGLVDAVLSEDVDTLMFGCGLTLRNWSSEGARNKSPTHISAYYATETKAKSGLDREGMILVALMSGGDYNTDGIPNCGPKIACEAARAGYGKSLCQISRSDPVALEKWRKDLRHEIQTNESKHFKQKHKALVIPDTFPDRDVLGFYTHPVVSSAPRIEQLKEGILWDGEVDIQGLRQFVAEEFEWTGKDGAIKYVRTLAPALLMHKLRLRGSRRASGYGDLILTAMNEMELVREICGKRTHISSDGIPETRVVYQPLDIVPLDLEEEPNDDCGDYGRDGLAPILQDDQIEAYQSDDNRRLLESPSKRAAPQYDPTQPDKAWIPETIVRLGVPLKLEDYEESLRNPKKFLKQKAAAKKASSKKGAKNVVQKGAMDRFVTVSKQAPKEKEAFEDPDIHEASANDEDDDFPPLFLIPSLVPASTSARKEVSTRVTTSKPKQAKTSKAQSKKNKVKPSANSTPWGTGSQDVVVTKPLNARQSKSISPPPASFRKGSFPIDLTSSSPPCPSPKEPDLPASRKHLHSPTLSESDCENPSLQSNNQSSPFNPPTSKTRNPSRPPPRKKVSLESEDLPQTSDHNVPQPTTAISPQDLDMIDILKSPGVTLRKGRARRRNTKPTTVRRASSPDLPTLDKFLKPRPERNKTPERKQNKIITLSSSPEDLASPSLPKTHTTQRQISTNNPSIPDTIPSSPPQPQTMAPPPRHISTNHLHPPNDDNVLQEEGTDTQDPFASAPPPPPKKKFIILRDSLPGGWKPVEEEELEESGRNGKEKGKKSGKARKAWRMSEVEVCDLTSD
ncbi:hypothetical protein HYFRA_00000644 [Hymenoscyphus fraxineus]|uniref:XPG-I domain-containing protein n=1 Tax=Hymenoscyphus fraxineus TaxID=746836 RepID=A0A9N9L2I5_9HELO|nr:hypothetical protein HYFRA_00000644 [Hymenoscyphus fraxineus]